MEEIPIEQEDFFDQLDQKEPKTERQPSFAKKKSKKQEEKSKPKEEEAPQKKEEPKEEKSKAAERESDSSVEYKAFDRKTNRATGRVKVYEQIEEDDEQVF